MNVVFTEFASQPKERQTYGRTQAQLQKLEELFNTFQSHHSKVISAKNVNYEHEFFTSNLIPDTEDYYCENKGQFNNFIHELDLKQSNRTILLYSKAKDART